MAMPQKRFWSIVDSAHCGKNPDRASQVQEISVKLQELTIEELAAFKKWLNRMLFKSYKFDIMIAAFVIKSTITDDLFLDFRSWLILQGQDVFKNVLHDVDVVAELVYKKDVDRINSAGFAEIATRIWLDRGASLALFQKKAGFIDTPKVKQNWPADKEDFQSRYPALYKKFWNANRIRSLSGN